MQQAGKLFEEAFAGKGNTLENMVDSIDKLTKSQERYLTKTNKLYETNKMIREA
jgi:hypothetical protein